MSDYDSADESQASSESDGFETLHLRTAVGEMTQAEAGLRDVTVNFERLENDLLREEGDNVGSVESDDDADFFTSNFDDNKKKKKKGKDGEEPEDVDPNELVEFFDFRRGPKHWPRGVELISEEKGRELIESAMEEANKKQDKEKSKGSGGATGASAGPGKTGPKYQIIREEDDVFGGSMGGGKKGDGEKDDEEGEKREGGVSGPMGPGLPMGMGMGFMSAPSSDEELPQDPDEDLLDPEAVARARENPAPPDAKFEYQRDRSTALLIQPGQRLKLDISGLTHTGLEAKRKAERTRMREAMMSETARAKAEKKARDKKKRSSAYAWYDSDWDKELWSTKSYLNEYTITFDIKLKREAPREGLALFQTALVYTEENPSSGRKTIKQSDGECVIGTNGGVGVFGQLGDVTRAKVDVDRWRRVVISVKNVAEGKGEMRTWIDTVPCAVIKRDAFAVDGRFALDLQTLYLFSSQKGGMMPGDVLLRCVRVQHGASTDDLVKSEHAMNKLISMHEEERAQRVEEQRKDLSLAKLFPKPRPLWTAPAFIGAIGDPFIEKTVYEGSSIVAWSFRVMHFALRRSVEEQPAFLHGLGIEQRQAISNVLLVLHQSSPLMQQMLKLFLHANESQVMSFLGKLKKFLGALGVGDSLMLPVIIEGYEMIIIVSRNGEQMFRFVIVATDPERGLGVHPGNPSLGPKLKYQTCLVLSNIPKKNALDNVFWMAVYSLTIQSGPGDLIRFYDVLLPFLTGKPLETSLWESQEASIHGDESGEIDPGVIGDWCSPQRSSTAYVRCFLHAVRYMLRSQGLSILEAKQVVLGLRAQLVSMMNNDLQFVSPDDNGQRVCRMACSQLNYATVKLVDAMEKSKVPQAKEFAALALAATKKLVDSIDEKVAAYADVQVELPPILDLRDKLPVEEQEALKKEDKEEIKRRAIEDSELSKEDRSGKEVELTIRHGPTGALKVKLFSTSRVLHLQTRLAIQLGVGMDEQRLIYMGRLLKSDSTIQECGLADAPGLSVQLTSTTAVAKPEETDIPDPKKEELNADQRMRKIRAALRKDPDAPAMKTQFMDALAWDVEQSEPNPGMAVSLRKYVPIDALQMPSKVQTRDEAVMAIRLCDRLCTLLDNQPHCVKNDRFLIAALIQHTFTQLIPFPKPRGINRGETDAKGRSVLDVSARNERRKLRKAQRREKRKAKAELKKSGGGDTGESKTASAAENGPGSNSAVVVVATPKANDEQPDFARGSAHEALITAQECIWDQEITYELQVELLLELQRISEHFVASVFSIQQDRPFDSVVIVTMGCIAALSDAIIRRRASDLPSEVCSHLLGQTRDGRQLGVPGYGISPASFATQTETIEAHTPELCIARTAVLDYFQSPQQRRLEKIFNWERHYELKPDRELIKYLRAVQREIAQSDPNVHLLLIDGSPVESSLIKRNYPELRCYRDITFFWKCLMNPDVKAFPNWIDTRRDAGGAGTLGRFGRLAAQLHWQWEQNQSSAGYIVYCQFQGIVLRCRPEPDRDAKGETFSKERQPPTHRFPSTATPSFYVPDLPLIRTEDDVIYRPNLPGFEDDHEPKKRIKALMPSGSSFGGFSKSSDKPAKKGGKESHHPVRQHVLGQHDSELLISYLTVPYLRLPLVLTFFASDDRLHKLQSHKLRAILDSVMFEPGRYLSLDLVGVAPTMVPTPHANLLATPYGLLLNELVRSPDTVLNALDTLLEGALALDTGSVCDLGEDDFNVSVDIILYIARLGARCEAFVSFLIAIAKKEHECFAGDMILRDLEVTPDCLTKLEQGRAMLRRRLLKDFVDLFEDYLKRLDNETKWDPGNEKLIDRNSRLAADLHAIKILFHRNTRPSEYDNEVARTLIGSFVFLTTRHTWNKPTRQSGRLLVPETELYEVLQVQRRRLIGFCRGCQQGPLDQIMQCALQIATSSTGSYRASGEIVDAHNRWARIAGDRSVGRFAVGSTRTVGEDESSVLKKHSSALVTESKTSEGSEKKGIPMVRQKSQLSEVAEVPDSGILGVELDLQIGQMTLRSKHLSALPGDIAGHPDVRLVFGTATMQASLLERSSLRTVYRLVGLNHDIESWHAAHAEAPPIPDGFERDYDPSELFDSESWIPPLFEPIRKSYFDGPNPPPMQFLMLERPMPEHAEVAVLIGVHQLLGGMSKLVYLFRRLRCVHVYQAVSHGRRFWWTLHLTTDVRYCLRELQPSYAPRSVPPPAWWKYGSGAPYPPSNGVAKFLYDDIVSPSFFNSICERSVLIIRDAAHPENLSNGKEMLIPSRFLLGLVPQCLLESYRFWRDESDEATRGRLGYMRLMGYPEDEEDEFIIKIEIQAQRNMEICGHVPARSVRVIRKLKVDVIKECEQNRRLAEVLEQSGLLVRDSKALRKARRLARQQKRAAAASSSATGNGHGAGEDDADADDEEDEEEDERDEEGARKGENDEEDEDEDEDDEPFDMVVGAVVEFCFRTNIWTEAVIQAVHDDDTVDVELRGDVNNGLVLQRVHPRDIRKKRNADAPAKDDEDEEDGQHAKQTLGKRLGIGKSPRGGMNAGKWIGGRAPRGGRGGGTMEGQGVWHWDGMSDSDDADWASDSSRDEDADNDGEDGDANARSKKAALTFTQIDALQLLLEACGWDEQKCMDALKRLPPPPEPYTNVMRLARVLARFISGKSETPELTSHLRFANEQDYILLNALYAPKGSRLHSMMKTLARIENMSNVLVWTKASNLPREQRLHGELPHDGIPTIDLVELPRLKLSFTARPDHSGVVRLYSLDHADLYVSNDRNPMTSKMLEGIPHSLLMCNTQGETSVLVPVVSPRRPIINSEPFSTQLVLHRTDTTWNAHLTQRYFLYPVHVSLSFLMSKGIDSGLYLLLLRFLHRDYVSAFRLADSIASDTAFSAAGQTIFHTLALSNDDFHPDAHACRLKISLVTIDSGVPLPWDLTLQCARYIIKLSHVSASCRISLEEELQLLETEGAIAYEPSSPAYKPALHTPYVRAIVRNRQQALYGMLNGKDVVSCYAPPRIPLTNWPYYQDNTVFGVVYEEMIEVKTAEEWEEILHGE